MGDIKVNYKISTSFDLEDLEEYGYYDIKFSELTEEQQQTVSDIALQNAITNGVFSVSIEDDI